MNDGSQGEPADGPANRWRQRNVLEVVIAVLVGT